MYGYVIPDKPNMYMKDYGMYRAYYCGLCKTLGKTGGQLTRFATNYDCTFLSIFAHATLGKPSQIEPQVCVLNPVQKKPMAIPDEISKRVADATVLLAHYKADDDVRDGDGKKRIFKFILRRRVKLAKKELPASDAALKQHFARLAELESENSKHLDAVADCFSQALAAIVKELLGEKFDDNIYDFAYNLGRWIYFVDAIDDIEDDFNKKRYNPLLLDGFSSKREFLEKNKEELGFLLRSSYNKIVGAYNDMDIKAGETVGEGVLSNIVYLGMPAMMDSILGGKEECRKTRL